MQQIYLSHNTALEVIRSLRLSHGDLTSADLLVKQLILPNNTSQNSHILIADILINDINKKSSSTQYNYHIKQKHLPKLSFFRLSNKIYCSSGEFTTVQLAKKLCYEHLFLLVLELCGTYTIDINSQDVVSQLEAFTTVKNLKTYAEKFKGLNPHTHGMNNLLEILDIAEDNSASPMESRLFVKLCGPRKRGCYNCKNLKMNNSVYLSEKASRIAGQKIVKPDLSCIEKKIAIEYDSTQFHENTEQGQKDKRRRDALVFDG